jgi:hypothetical protein
MPSKQSSKLPIAGIASIAVATAALVFTHDIPYLETRPAQNRDVLYDLAALEQVDARLWQDPFSAVNEFEIKESARAKFDADAQRDRSAAEAAATLEGATSARFTTARYGRQPSEIKRAISEMAQRSSRATGSPAFKPLTVLAVTMAGNPSVGAEETRRRERYAVVSALGAANFAPADDEHIGYIVLHYRDGQLQKTDDRTGENGRDKHGPQGLWGTSGKSSPPRTDDSPEPADTSFRLPFEIFQSSDKSDAAHARRIMIWWVDDAALSATTRSGNWLKEIGGLLEFLAPCGNKRAAGEARALDECSVRVIGPSSSDEYAMLDGSRSSVDGAIERPGPAEPMTVLSPNVTSNLLSMDSPVANQVAAYANVISTIPPDEVVFAGLTEELYARNIPICRGDSAIVLLSEWDTEYGRRASDALTGAIAQVCDRKSPKSPYGHARVEAYSFLRGLDGVLLGSNTSALGARAGNSSSDKLPNAATQIEWPETADQRDYVRRLGERIAEGHPQTKGIQAIGIVASDTHDKLLLLQALRQKFTALPFFTTDADARLAHPAVQRWTGNLIVASGYGLFLRRELQRNTPPFRDVYQTSTYLATLLSIQEVDAKDLKKIADRWTKVSEILEVGKTRLVALDNTPAPESNERTPGSGDPWKPECSVKSLEACDRVTGSLDAERFSAWQSGIVICLVAVVLVTIATVAIRSYRRLPPSDGRGWMSRIMSVKGAAKLLCILLVVVLSFSLYLTVVAVGIWTPKPAEPGILTQGVSSVSVALCWCLALGMTLFFLLRIATTIRPRFAKLEREFVGGARGEETFDSEPRRSFIRWAWGELSNRDSSTASGANSEKLEHIWALYKYHSFSRMRPLRILIWWTFMYVIPVIVLTAWLPMPTFPIRGMMHTVLPILAPVGFLSLMILNALVADSVFACSIFVMAVGRRRNEYPASVVASTVKRYELLPPLRDNIDSILDTELIAARTAMVADYLYYPFVVMAILALGLFATYEHWAQWPGRFIVIGLAICEVGGLWGLLRWSAERARAMALRELEAAELRALREHVRAPNLRASVVRQCRMLRQHISVVREGAYAALQDQPIVRALLLPLGGAGAAQLWEFLTSRLS